MLSGCATTSKKVTVNVLNNQDLIAVEAGSKIETTNKTFMVDRDGYFVSKSFMNQVMEAWINQTEPE